MNNSGEYFKNIVFRKYAAAAISASPFFLKHTAPAFSIYMPPNPPAIKTPRQHCPQNHLISTLFS
jgi:hypothetical protein